MAVARCTVPLSVCPAGKTVQSTGEDIGDIWKSGGSVKKPGSRPPESISKGETGDQSEGNFVESA